MRKVASVFPGHGFTLLLAFDNGERRVFDMKPYLDRGVFRELKDPGYFGQVRVAFDSIAWPHGQDLDPDHLYMEGVDEAATCVQTR
jgi:hypothetical protein